MAKKEYKNAAAFRAAIEDRIKSISTKEKIGIERLRRQFAYDRLLARLFTGSDVEWVLKGGYAMQLRVSDSRATKDVDLAVREAKLLSGDSDSQGEALLALVQKKARLDQEDFFEFIVTGPIKDLDAAPYGGARFHIEAKLDNRPFEKFHLDMGVGDVWIEPLDQLKARSWIEGMPARSFPAISKEQQFAEKLHAYTLPRQEGRPNSRVKDLVDMVLLIQTESLDKKRLKESVRVTFERRRTHDVPEALEPPPERWEDPFVRLAKECDLEMEIGEAYELVKGYIEIAHVRIL